MANNTVNITNSNNTVTITPQNNNTVNTETTLTSVSVTQGSTSVVTVNTPGPQGIQGEGANIDTGSLVTTSSFATYTGSADSTFAGTSSFATSASYSLTSSYVNPLNQLVQISGSLETTGSTNLQYLTASGLIYPTIDGERGDILQTDGEGNLTFERTKIYAQVKNKAGTLLYKGTPVHVIGSIGNLDEVIAASASNASTMPATFVLAENLNDDEEGLAILTGFINGVNTSGFGEGDVVYVGENGGYTNLKPTGSNLIQNLGIVTKVGTNGSGFIYGSGRSNDVPNLLEGNIFFGSGSNQAYITHISSALDSTTINNITSSGTISAITGAFSHIIGNSPITVQDSVTFQSDITASGDLKVGSWKILSSSNYIIPESVSGTNGSTFIIQGQSSTTGTGGELLLKGGYSGGPQAGAKLILEGGDPYGQIHVGRSGQTVYLNAGGPNSGHGAIFQQNGRYLRFGWNITPGIPNPYFRITGTSSDGLHFESNKYYQFSNDTIISGSLTVSQSVSASTYYGDGSNLTGIETDPFPYTGSAVISGSLEIIGDTNVTGSINLLNSSTNRINFNNAAAINQPQIRLKDYATGITMRGNDVLALMSNGSGMIGIKKTSIAAINFPSDARIGFTSNTSVDSYQPYLYFHRYDGNTIGIGVYGGSSTVNTNGRLILQHITASGHISASTYYGDGSNLTGVSSDPFPYTGSAIISGSLEVVGDITGSLSIEGSGSTLFEVNGSSGQLFSITDSLSGSLFAVSDVSGLPILEVFSDDTIKMGSFNAEALEISGSDVNFNNLPTSDPGVAGRLYQTGSDAIGATAGFQVVCISQG